MTTTGHQRKANPMWARETIIVPVDGTHLDARTVPVAMEEAIQRDASLVLLYVVERPEQTMHDLAQRGPRLVNALRRGHETNHSAAAFAYLEHLRRHYHLFANTELVVRCGDPVTQIELEAAERHRPLVIITAGTNHDDSAAAVHDRNNRILERGRCRLMFVTPSRPDTPATTQVLKAETPDAALASR